MPGTEAAIRQLYRDIREGRLGRAEAEQAIKRLQAQSAPSLRLRYGDPYLRDHRIDGEQVVIGVTYAALAARRFLAANPQAAGVRLRRLLFVDPVKVPEGTAIALQADLDTAGRCTVSAQLDAAAWVPAATCEIDPLANPAAPSSVTSDYQGLTAIAADRLYRANPYVVWGPSFETIATAAASQTDAVLQLDLPAGADAVFDPAIFAIDPRVLNGVLFGAFATLLQRGLVCALLPLSVGQLDIFAVSSQAPYRIAVRLSRLSEEMLTVEAEITDATGVTVSRWRDFGLKRMTQEAKRSPDERRPAVSSSPPADGGGDVRAYLDAAITRVLGRPVLDGARNLLELGLESRHLIALAEELRQELDIDLMPTVFFEYPSLDALADHFTAHFQDAVRRHTAPAHSAHPRSASRSVEDADAPIAIIGMAGRLAKSPDLDSFWQNMAARREMITDVPAARWNVTDWFDADREASHKSYCKWGSFIDDIAAFDPLFFNISPQQAMWLDPQARHLLEAAYHAAEDAGCAARLRGSRTGVFAGVCFQEYWDEIIRNRIPLTGHEHSSSYRSSVAAHVSYALDLRGPSLPLDNACASSLSALHLACQSLRLGECEMAFACGINLLISPLQFVYFSRIQAMSPSGRCHSFDSRADGFVPGEGAIALLLKPLHAAERDGDPIHAVIRGSAINHTGRAPNPTAPRPETQTDVLRMAWARAGVQPQDLSYIECHGTGTQLGDPIEINALKKAFGAGPVRPGGCVIGSVKADIGHLEGAAGLASVVKVVQSMKHLRLLPMPQFRDLNPMIKLDDSPMRILREAEVWDDSAGPRIAGVSGFGMTGNGAHVVIEAYTAPATRFDAPHDPQLILLSAKDGERLRAAAQALRIWLDDAGAAAWLPDIAYTLQTGREAFDERLAFIARDHAEMRETLNAFLSGSAAVPQGRVARNHKPVVMAISADDTLERLRDAWLAGAMIDWSKDTHTPAARHISLPGYAFARDTYWFTAEHREPVADMPLAASVDLDGLLIRPLWQPKALPDGAASARIHRALLVTSQTGRALAEAIAARLPSSLILAAEDGLDGIGDALGDCDTLVFLAGAGTPDTLADIQGLTASQTVNEMLALRLMQAWGKARRADRPMQVFIILANSFPGSADGANPVGAGLCGLAYALAQSDPRMAVRNIDLGAAAFADGLAHDALAAAILREPAHPRGEVVRLNAGLRYQRQFEPVALPPSAQAGLRQDGVYVIIGGAGTVGSVLTRWLLNTYRAKVIWVGRRPRHMVSTHIAALAALGGTLDYIQADATDAAQLRDAVDEIRRRHGMVHGAVYAPVVFSFANSVAETSEAAFSDILNVKTRGSIAFYDAFKDLHLDFLCFFSSCQAFAFSGAARLSAYATGISFADSFATAISAEAPFPVGIINWGFWRAFTEGRLWRQYQAEHPKAAAPEHIGFLEDAEGIACFERFVAQLRAKGGGAQIACLRQSAAVHDLIRGEPPTATSPMRVTEANMRMASEVPLRDRLAGILGEILLMPANHIEDESPFAEYGIDSITSAGFVSRINAVFGCGISATALYDYPTLAGLAAHVAALLPQDATGNQTVNTGDEKASLGQRSGRDAIAVIGMALQVPGAETPDEFWTLLRDGRVSLGRIGKRDVFDPLFFHISPREAEEMSPYQRLMLQEAWRCLEDGGYNPKALAQSETGVFIGAEPPSFDRLSLTGSSEALIAARISYFLNLKGPALVINTGCSSSAVALHLACESLRRGESDLALAGGIFADLGPEVLRLLSGIGMVSASGGCRPFDARADGTVISEGLAMVALKRLDDALADGDPIRGVIIASAMNQDGASNGITAPNGRAQEALLRKIYHRSGIDPARISYVEAHGTGTVLGDPIEVNALGRVFADAGAAAAGCRLGTAKANIGHAAAAAGVIGLIKILLSMAHDVIPGLPGFQTANPKIDMAGWRIGAEASPWPAGAASPRRAALNSFGHSGTNVHLVVEEAVLDDWPATSARQEQLVPLSAGTPGALRRQVENLARYLSSAQGAKVALAALAWTLQFGRLAGQQRIVFQVDDLVDLRAELGRFLTDEHSPRCWRGHQDPDAVKNVSTVPSDRAERARHWVNGGTLDWRKLHAVLPRRVNLPSSVFAELAFPLRSGPTRLPALTEMRRPISESVGGDGLMRLPVWRPAQISAAVPALAPCAVRIVATAAGMALAQALEARETALGSTVFHQDMAAIMPVGTPGRVYLLAWADDAPNGPVTAGCDVDVAVLKLITQLKRNLAQDATIDVFILTRDAATAGAGFSGAGAAGLAYALAQSDHRFRVRNIDLAAAETNSAGCATAIMAEPASNRGERLRLEHGQRLGLSFPLLAPVPADVPSGLHHGGVYVIAGGAGTVGSVITRFLIRDYDAQVIWLGRSPVEAAKVQTRLAPFASLPKPPLYLQADVTDAPSLAAAVTCIRDHGWHINGAIFSSLVFAFDDRLDSATEATFRDIVDVKLTGSFNFCRALAGESLDFLCYFSSGQAYSFSGATQFTSYAAAMTAADTLVRGFGRQQGFPVGILNWGFWKSSIENERLAANIDFIEDEEGFRCFRDFLRLLRQGHCQQVLCLRASAPVLALMAGSEGLARLAPRLNIGPSLRIPADAALEGLVAGRQPPDLDRWMAHMLLHYLQSMGVLAAGKWQTIDAVQKTAGILPKYTRWLHEALAILEQNGIVNRRGLELTADIEVDSAYAGEWAMRAAEMRRDPQWRSNVELLDACLVALPRILRGAIPATEILFPGGSADGVAAVYSGNALFDSLNGTVARAVSAFLDARLMADAGASARIIEIGAGTGGTTKLVLPQLGRRDDIADYVFTDVSRSFLIDAEARFKADHPYFKTELWNIEHEVAPPRIDAGAYDVVIATNVLHATRDMVETLRHAKSALKAGGILLINEITRNDAFGTLTFGLLDGWWLYDDAALRVPGSPLLAPQTWIRLLHQAGFGPISVLAGHPDQPGYHVIQAVSDGILLPPRSAPEVVSSVPPARVATPVAAKAEALAMPDTAAVRDIIRTALSEATKLPVTQIGLSTALSDYGVDSILGISFIDSLNAKLGLSLNPAIIFEHATVERLAQHAAQLMPIAPTPMQPAQVPEPEAVSQVTPQASVEGGAIAVIGIAGQFPDAPNVEALWRNARDGHDALRELPAAYLVGRSQEMRGFKWGGVLADRDCFDPLFFAITPREAESMSPHQRLVMQEGWKALEDAAIDPKSLDGKPVGIYIGAEPSNYLHESFSGQSDALVASRLAYLLNLRGPALVVNTGCSSSGVALHLACESLRRGETDLALAGGVCANLDHADLLNLLGIGMLSPSGKCHSFSAEADGTVMSEAVGMVVLKRLDDALRDGDPIHACIVASGVNQDGASNGITAPNGAAQEALIRQTYERFSVDPTAIGYVETHGTGTTLGDVVEANALTRAFAQFTDQRHFCAVGSAKSHIGHSSAASGVTGLIHAIMAMRHTAIPGLLHFTGLNPLIAGDATALHFSAATRDWHRIGNRPRMAALNCFGHSGSNAHFVLREADLPLGVPGTANGPMPVLVPLSARNEVQLRAVAKALHDALLPAQDVTGIGGDNGLDRIVTEELAGLLDVAPQDIALREPLADIGVTGEHLVALRRRLEQRLGQDIAAAVAPSWTSVATIVATLRPLRAGAAVEHVDLASVAMTLQIGRAAMATRAILLVSNIAELRDKLMRLAQGEAVADGCWTGRADASSDLLGLFEADDDLSETVANWAMRGRLDKVATVWARGVSLDWRRMHATTAYRSARRLHLPGYPFARERYRKPPAMGKMTPIAAAASLGSALLHRNESDLRGLRFTSRFDADTDVLRDHCIGATSLLPAAAAIEMAVAAATVATRGDLSGLSLTNLTWSRTMPAGADGLALHTRVTQPDGAPGLRIDIADAEGMAWFGADAVWDKAQAARVALADLQQSHRLPGMTAAAFYDAVMRSGVALGPSFRLVAAVQTASGESSCLVRLALPEALEGSFGRYGLHPCVIDAALQTVMALQGPQDGPMLPFAIDRIDIHADTRGLAAADTLFVWTRPAASTEKVDIDLLGATGEPVITLRGVMMRRATQTARTAEALVGPVLLAPVWTMLPREAPRMVAGGRLLVAGDLALLPGGDADWGMEVTARAVGSQHTLAELLAMLDALPTPERILWLAPAEAPCAIGDGGLIAQQQGALLPFFRFVKAALQAGLDTRAMDWTIVTRGGAAVVPGEAVNSSHASLQGFVGSLTKEVPAWSWRILDLGWDMPGRPGTEALLAVPPQSGGEPVALRGGDWFVRKLVPVEPESPIAEQPSPQGVTVIIGGAGGIGAVWSEAMIRHHSTRIVWIGRRPCDDGIQALIDKLGQQGPSPAYVQADAADGAALREAVTRIRAEHGPIRGLVHSAIVLADQTVTKMTEDQLQAALRPKVDICVQMAQAFAAEPLDFVLFFSSVQSFLKMPGQGNYAAGSCFIDSFAEAMRQAWPCAVRVMNWGYWGGVGIVSAPAYRSRMQAAGMGSIEPKQALEALEQLVAGSFDQLALMTADKPLHFDGLEPGMRLRLPAMRPPVLEGLAVTLPATGPEIDYIRTGGDFRMAVMEPYLRDIVAAQLQALDVTEAAMPLAHLRRWLAHTPPLLAAVSGGLPVAGPSLAAAWAAWDAAKPAWLAEPSRQAQVVLVETALRALPDILSGRRLATSVLMPDASLELVENVYRNNLASQYFNLVLAASLAAVVERLWARDPSAKLRILEIGAGTGASSAVLFRTLAQRGLDGAIGEYLYTDISHAFLAHAQDRFGPDVPYLRTTRLDIDRPLAAQGVAEGSYDLVVAANSLHTTRDIRRAVRHAKSALRAGGVLLLNEISGATLYGHLTFGLLEGWWLFDEPSLRIPGCPGLSAEAWTQVLRQTGFSAPQFPAEGRHDLGLQIILAESDGVIIREATPEPISLVRSVAPPVSQPAQAAALPSGDLLPRAVDLLTGLIADATRIPRSEIVPSVPFEAYGIDSIVVIELARQLRKVVPDASTTLFFEHQTVSALAQHLASARSTDLAAYAEPLALRPVAAAVALSVVSPTLVAPMQPASVAEPDKTEEMGGFPVAIIGLAGRYPRAATLQAFWDNLAAGLNCITEVPPERWAWQDYFDSVAGKAGAISTRWGGFIDGIDRFDPLFFGIAPVEAEAMNPQERLFLQIAWACIEEAGYTPDALTAQGKVGVFVGVMNDTYHRGAKHWSVANRVSYHCNFQGPSLAVDTACSSSLTALHLALESLQSGSCGSALVGGVNLITNPLHSIGLSAMRVLSRDDRNKSFAADADGFVDGEGVGAVLLKPLRQAVADGDHIHGVIRGSAINAGGKVNGYTVPNPRAQADVVAEALARAHVHPRTVSYVEAHGTGTVLGDPIEIAGLTAAFGRDTQDTGFCAIGAVKSNIGHGESVAGLAGLTKILLQMKHRQLAPSLHAIPLNPEIDFARTPFRVQTAAAPWEPATVVIDGAQPIRPPRRAGLSSFGAGGANAHVVIEEYPQPAAQPETPVSCLLPLSAKTAEQLQNCAINLRDALADAEGSLANIAFTLQQGRVAFEHRLAVIAEDRAAAMAELGAFLAGESAFPCWVTGQVRGAVAADPGVEAAFESGDLDALARFWVSGSACDWQRLRYDGRPRRRVSLPTYPFAEERYWAPDLPVPPALPTARPTTHESLFRSFSLTGDESFLRDHKVAGAPVLPGVAYLRFAWQSLADQIGAASVTFSDVVWVSSCRPQGQETVLQFEMTPEPGMAGRGRFTFSSGPEGARLLHCKGRLAWSQDEAPAVPRRDITALAAACHGYRITPDQLQAVFRRLGVEYGPSHLALGPIARGGDQALAPLAAAEHPVPLHPGLLDSAFQAGLCFIDGVIDDATITDLPLPFALRQLDILRPNSSLAWVYLSRQTGAAETDEPLAIDLELLAADGTVALRFTGLSSRVAARTSTVVTTTVAATEDRMDGLLAQLVRRALPEAQAVLPFYRPWLAQTDLFLAKFPANASSSDALWVQWNAHRDGWLADPALHPRVRLLEAAVPAMADVLTGARKATDILFPNASLALVEPVYRDNPTADAFNAILAQRVAGFVAERSRAASNARLRILEIGAGTGGTTRHVLEHLRPWHESVGEYRYTDRSQVFLQHGAQQFGAAHPFLVTQLLDIEQPVDMQGLTEGGFDIVIAANVLHATRDMRATMGAVRRCLRDGGLLVVNELVGNALYAHVSFGLLEGWWRYDDPDLRLAGSPGLAPETWAMLLAEQGFGEIAFPAEAQHALGQQIISALAVCVKNPASQNEQDARSRFLRHTIRAHVARSLKLADHRIDDDRSFSDYGVDSILAVNLVNDIAEAVDAPLTTTVVFDHNTVDRLTQHILQTYPGKVPPNLPVAAPEITAAEPAPLAKPRFDAALRSLLAAIEEVDPQPSQTVLLLTERPDLADLAERLGHERQLDLIVGAASPAMTDWLAAHRQSRSLDYDGPGFGARLLAFNQQRKVDHIICALPDVDDDLDAILRDGGQWLDVV